MALGHPTWTETTQREIGWETQAFPNDTGRTASKVEGQCQHFIILKQLSPCIAGVGVGRRTSRRYLDAQHLAAGEIVTMTDINERLSRAMEGVGLRALSLGKT